jgi:hypothetical protein
MTAERSTRDWLAFGLLGVAFAFGYGLLGVSLDGQSLSGPEAWALGVTQPYVVAGVLLVVLALFLRAGAAWARWLIVAWCPVNIVGGMAWVHFRGFGVFDPVEFLVLGVPLMIGWVWAVWRTLFVHKALAAS